ncbi:MAG: signal peptidase I [Candidatus Doudnabacteria bacterium RIFCSPHIGHO2_01_FULL_46_14]|uniref:Signal peptidase I n=1 Tax=Candidatus Doudnabacteria bacterium RIFCSPHIGHO2_01_FULL_46_14 TaxID=1817824 RepID=A0A1F5NND7_9BACT|nr:MAG: signal peptidase I [Candidatus Doudnabacteria bacterium RIFCSPHIGHO2_01_FULL_46_14]
MSENTSDNDTQKETQSALPADGHEPLRYFFFDFLKVFLMAVAIIIPVRYFLFQPFVVTGDSMRPNFHDGNYLIIDELTYRFREPSRGEVVVMRFPKDPSQFFIKRIVALPSEHIVIRDGRVTIYNSENQDGILLEEPYLVSQNITYGNIDRKLKEDEFFVLGDNRLSSSDSRVWGILPKDDIIGRVYLRLFPVQELELFIPSPVYND